MKMLANSSCHTINGMENALRLRCLQPRADHCQIVPGQEKFYAAAQATGVNGLAVWSAISRPIGTRGDHELDLPKGEPTAGDRRRYFDD